MPNLLQIPSLSTEYVHATIDGPPNKTSYDAEMAILPEGQDPTSGDWETAAWSGDDVICLVGPATAIPLTRGVRYEVWVRITASPEIPVLRPGFIHAT
ncbi:hypothetical protein [Nonomuraea sp. GTA35]|uniref:hypothetical protein n=1 Tax=Nonomuraea sp. GTA35 TaxID=1676746 RepID=UPI0035BFE5B5